MRRFMFVLGAFLALAIVASPADAQIIGGKAAGLGGRAP